MALSLSSFAGKAVSARRVAPRAAARSVVVVSAAAGRPLWYPSAAPPAYLNGSLAGDYGFDPLRLGATSASLPWYVEAERQNGRWAMAAVAGILATELIGAGGNWWVPDASQHVANGAPTARVFAEAALMAVAESFRLKAFDASGPGSKAFDPANMNSEESRLKEIKNGRLAMVAFLGFTSQAAVRGLGPIACLKAHLADPGHVNIFTSSVGGEACAAVVALSIAPMFLAAQKTLKSADDKEEFRPIPW